MWANYINLPLSLGYLLLSAGIWLDLIYNFKPFSTGVSIGWHANILVFCKRCQVYFLIKIYKEFFMRLRHFYSKKIFQKT